MGIRSLLSTIFGNATAGLSTPEAYDPAGVLRDSPIFRKYLPQIDRMRDSQWYWIRFAQTLSADELIEAILTPHPHLTFSAKLRLRATVPESNGKSYFIPTDTLVPLLISALDDPRASTLYPKRVSFSLDCPGNDPAPQSVLIDLFRRPDIVFFDELCRFTKSDNESASASAAGVLAYAGDTRTIQPLEDWASRTIENYPYSNAFDNLCLNISLACKSDRATPEFRNSMFDILSRRLTDISSNDQLPFSLNPETLIHLDYDRALTVLYDPSVLKRAAGRWDVFHLLDSLKLSPPEEAVIEVVVFLNNKVHRSHRLGSVLKVLARHRTERSKRIITEFTKSNDPDLRIQSLEALLVWHGIESWDPDYLTDETVVSHQQRQADLVLHFESGFKKFDLRESLDYMSDTDVLNIAGAYRELGMTKHAAWIDLVFAHLGEHGLPAEHAVRQDLHMKLSEEQLDQLDLLKDESEEHILRYALSNLEYFVSTKS